MGIINNLIGNATEINVDTLKREFEEILCDNETIEVAFNVFRDKWVFTSARLIIENVQGVTGSKRSYHTIPYHSITHFAVETSGSFDLDTEIKIWIRGTNAPYEQKFSKGTNVRAIQKMLAYKVL